MRRFRHTTLVRLLTTWLVAAGPLGLWPPSHVRADEPAVVQPDLFRNVFWLSASATLLSASLAGMYALRVSALYDRSRSLPNVSPELVSLRNDAEHAEHAADALFIATAVLAGSSIALFVLAWNSPSHPPNPAASATLPTEALTLSASALPGGAALVWRGRWL